MYSKNRFLCNAFVSSDIDSESDLDVIEEPCECLGTKIANQMYHGVNQGNSTLLSGQFDDDDSWDVDPACDMSTDTMDLRLSERVPTPQTPVDTPSTE